MSLDSILRTLSEELVRLGAVSSVHSALAMDRLQLAMLIMDNFIQYPLPARSSRWFPYNYCALSHLWPPIEPLLNLVC